MSKPKPYQPLPDGEPRSQNEADRAKLASDVVNDFGSPLMKPIEPDEIDKLKARIEACRNNVRVQIKPTLDRMIDTSAIHLPDEHKQLFMKTMRCFLDQFSKEKFSYDELMWMHSLHHTAGLLAEFA